MRKKLLLFTLLLFAFALKNDAQNRMVRANAANNSSANDKGVKDANGRIISGPNGGRQTLPQSSAQLTRITGLPVPTAAYSGYYREDFEGSFPPANWQVVDVLDPTY